MKKIAILVLGILVIGGGWFWWGNQPAPQINPEPIPAPTPTPIPTPEPVVVPAPIIKAKGTLVGAMTLGPICPVERPDEHCKPTAEMFAARKVMVYQTDKKTLVATLVPDVNGNFSQDLAIGTYFVDMDRSPIGGATGLPTTVKITAGQTTAIKVDVDTGIR